MRRIGMVCWVVSLALLAGCGTESSGSAPAAYVTPTLSPIFRPVTITPYPTPQRRPTLTPPPLPTESADTNAGGMSAANTVTGTLVEAMIFDETLNPNWGLENSTGMNYKVRDTTHAHSSTVGMRVAPVIDYGSLFFTVKPNSKEVYTRSQAFEVSFWLNSGTSRITQEDLAVTVVGSNAQAYWVADDKSVTVDDTRFFSENRLNYLGINHTIPPETWVEVRVELDKLPYEPDYTYITGIYIKNDKGFRQTFYIDQLKILMVQLP